MAAHLSHLQLAIMLALASGPIALIALGRVLPGCRDFGGALSDLLTKGWVKGRGGFPYRVELTEAGRRAIRATQR